MVYLLGVNLPDNKKVEMALTHIYGIGRYTGKRICHQLLIHPMCKLSELPEEKMVALSTLLNTIKIESDLKRQVQNNIKKMVQIGSFRGHRHQLGLPVKGQKTHANARTAKKLNGHFLKRSYATTTSPALTAISFLSRLGRCFLK